MDFLIKQIVNCKLYIVYCLILTPLLVMGSGPFHNAFNAGECSDLVKYRLDMQQYSSACREMENIAASVQGAATRRPGTAFASEAADSVNTRLIRFEYSTSDSYAIELGDKVMYFYRDGGRIAE
jgi:hypothetical protein